MSIVLFFFFFSFFIFSLFPGGFPSVFLTRYWAWSARNCQSLDITSFEVNRLPLTDERAREMRYHDSALSSRSIDDHTYR